MSQSAIATGENEQPVVGIDASRYAVVQRTGTETYSYELICALGDLNDPGIRFRLYTNLANPEQLADLGRISEVRSIPFPRLWTHARLSAEMVRHRPDLLFVPSHVVPLIHPRSVVTVHDLGYLHEPDAHPSSQRRMLDLTTRWSAKSARQIIAISETTKSDLIERYRVPEDQITVVRHGVAATYRPQPNDVVEEIRARYQLPERFVVAVGTIQPRKNLGRLAEAIALVRRQHPDLALVTAGRRGWLADQVVAEIQKWLLADAWLELGYVPPSDIAGLLCAAEVAALVSTYEGFGLPVLEAFGCGVPLVISDTSALIEVAGDAALVAEAGSAESIAARVSQLIEDAELRARLVHSGLERAREYTWERSARETVAVFRRALE